MTIWDFLTGDNKKANEGSSTQGGREAIQDSDCTCYRNMLGSWVLDPRCPSSIRRKAAQ